MIRKFSLVAVAAASLSAAALAPTSASAWGGWHGGWQRWGGRPGDRAGGSSTAAIERQTRAEPRPSAGVFFVSTGNDQSSTYRARKVSRAERMAGPETNPPAAT